MSAPHNLGKPALHLVPRPATCLIWTALDSADWTGLGRPGCQHLPSQPEQLPRAQYSSPSECFWRNFPYTAPDDNRFLLFYYVGVSKVLQQLGVIKPGHTKIAGASAGAKAPHAAEPAACPPTARTSRAASRTWLHHRQ
jgi:hypothetical protein